MKIQYKAAIIMALFGALIVILLSAGYDLINRQIVISQELELQKNISEQVAQRVDSHLKEKISVAITLASAPIIKQTLQQSNQQFAALSAKVRQQKIQALNTQWQNTESIEDLFIQKHLTNPLAQFLKSQQVHLPGEYGEIFLTNRFGVMIASTGKLTTLAHAHKYWWQASYDDGHGRVFLDDRGYDTSVDGYVLGVVVPIKVKGEIVGLLKSNVNIMGSLTGFVQDFAMHNIRQLKIVRTGGLVVSEANVTPLTTEVMTELRPLLAGKHRAATQVINNHQKQLVAVTPVITTMGSETVGFGGKKESIDHLKGNQGEGWHVVVAILEDKLLSETQDTTLLILIVGVIFALASSLVALFLGKWIANPIEKLALTARQIGEGDLTSKAIVTSNDEIGALAKCLNAMTQNLNDTMTSRELLLKEIKQREKTERALKKLSTTDELTGIYNRRAFDEQLATNLARTKRYQEPLSLLMIDIDLFKQVNDRYGHSVGDLVLKELVNEMKSHTRETDFLARWGGEEFVILLPQTEAPAAMQLAERLREGVAEHLFPSVEHLTVSIGHSAAQPNDSSDSLLNRADNALYQAKETGRNQVVTL